MNSRIANNNRMNRSGQATCLASSASDGATRLCVSFPDRNQAVRVDVSDIQTTLHRFAESRITQPKIEPIIDEQPLDPSKVRGWFGAYVADGCICQYCGFDGTRSPEHWLQLQGDHLLPRGIAGEHADESLNKVVNCYYCNVVKRDFDPSHGKLARVKTVECRRRLIETSKSHVIARKAKLWSYGGGLQQSFEFMLRHISASDRPEIDG